MKGLQISSGLGGLEGGGVPRKNQNGRVSKTFFSSIILPGRVKTCISYTIFAVSKTIVQNMIFGVKSDLNPNLDSMFIIKLKREILLKYRLMKNAESSTSLKGSCRSNHRKVISSLYHLPWGWEKGLCVDGSNYAKKKKKGKRKKKKKISLSVSIKFLRVVEI